MSDIDWVAELEWCIRRASERVVTKFGEDIVESRYIEVAELIRDKDYTVSELRACGQDRLLEKLDSILHANMIELGRGDEKLMNSIVMQNLKTRHGYTERVDVTSKGKELKLEVILPNLLEKV